MFLDKDGLTHEECIFWLRDHQDEVYKQFGYVREQFWSAEATEDQCMNVMQLENMFCELSKYARCVEAVMRGDKPRGKVGYDGSGAYKKRCDEVVLGRSSVNLLDHLKKPE
jgi:hypothetical protein